MTRGFPSRPVLSAALVLTLLMSVIGAASFSPVSAEPGQETASSSVSITNSITSPADEGPSARFAFSVLDQAATAITKTITSVDGATPGAPPPNASPGQLVSFLVRVTGASPNSQILVRDFLGAAFEAGMDTDVGVVCARVAPATADQPAAIVGGNPSVFDCRVTTDSAGAASFAVRARVAATATAGAGVAARNVACVGANATDVALVTTCAQAQVNIVLATPTPTATPTVTLTPTRTATPAPGAPPTPGVSGTPGQPCANTIGQTCTAGGGVTFSWTKTGSGVFTATATGPAGSLVGGIPTIFIPTTANANGESFLCAATTAALTTTCSGTTAGDPLCNGIVTVAFPLVGGGFGNVTSTPITGPNCVGAGTTLVVCKTITFPLGTGLGGAGGLGGVGIGLPGVGIGIGGIGTGIGGVGGLTGLTGSTVTFTTTAAGVTIPAITIPAGSTGPVCTAAIPVTVGTTLTITEVVPAGFTLQSVTGGTLAGNSATLTTVVGTNTVTFVNAPININLPNLPLLPPPPLQFIPPPPPPLLPPPPPAPMAGARAPAFPEVPVIPEADSLFLVVGGLVALGGLVGLRSLRRRRDDDA